MSARTKYLQLRPRSLLQAAPCAPEMTALFNCWSSAGIEAPACSEFAKAVTRCMATQATKGTARSNINNDLTRLRIPAVKVPRKYD
ncbi:40S ribosomal protein mrp10 [Sorochytrium milnesiophthora]